VFIYRKIKNKASTDDLKAKYTDKADNNPFNIIPNSQIISGLYSNDQYASTAKFKPLINPPGNSVYNQVKPDNSHNYLRDRDVHLELNYEDDSGRRSVTYHTPVKKRRNSKELYRSCEEQRRRIGNNSYPHKRENYYVTPTVLDIDYPYCDYRDVHGYTSKKDNYHTGKFNSVDKYRKKRSCSQDGESYSSSRNYNNREDLPDTPGRIIFTEDPKYVNKYKFTPNLRRMKINRFEN